MTLSYPLMYKDDIALERTIDALAMLDQHARVEKKGNIDHLIIETSHRLEDDTILALGIIIGVNMFTYIKK